MSALLHNYVVIGAILFGLGAIGFLTRRNLIIMFLSVEMMLQGVALNMVAFGDLHRTMQGQSFIVFMLTVAACEAAMALAVFIVLYRSKRTLDISVWQELRDPGQEPIIDIEPLPIEAEAIPVEYPKLTPAGLRPAIEAGAKEEVTRA
ncbi:MAG TPA: NADH-quinone oxidoreductase subunit NuoK [Gemmatales bacterium]|nr:NADH-quinone oxidoreductase subunit NuoK [Gemmatales bacterium]HMP17602.1 NADH-quinone oxidoreductase subunit NuoK [Gemmatales bacterium]